MRCVGLLLAILPITASATSLVAIRLDKEIVIAADSRVTNLVSDASLPDVCKVRQTGNAIAAFVGFVSVSNAAGAHPYDAMQTVEAILDEKGMLAEKAEKIRDTLHPQLAKLLRAATPAIRNGLNGFVLGIVIAARDEEESILKMDHIRFTLTQSGTLRSEVFLCPGDGCPRGNLWIVAPPPPDKLPPFTDPVHWARAYVQSQIDRDVPTIGGPLQLVRVTLQGLNWQNQPLICSK
jgi:hypothetical protein